MNIPDLKINKDVEQFFRFFYHTALKEVYHDKFKILGVPNEVFFDNFKKFVKKKNKFESENQKDYATETVVQYIRTIRIDRGIYDEVKALMPNSNFMAKVNKDLYSLTAYYFLSVFSLNPDIVSEDISNWSEKENTNYKKNFKASYNSINKQMDAIKKMAELEGVNFEKILQFIVEKDITQIKKHLLLSKDYWNVLKKEGNELLLVREWKEFFTPYLGHLLNFETSRDQVEDLYKFFDNLPLYLFDESFDLDGSLGQRSEKLINFGSFGNLMNDYWSDQNNLIREKDLLKELKNNKENKNKERRNKI